eukprot:g52520.t1
MLVQDAKQTMVESMEEQEDEDEEDDDEETAEAKKLSLQCRAGEAQGQQVDQGQTEAEQWACVRCTYLNGSDDSACGMCASPKPGVAPVMGAETLTRQAAAATSLTRPAPRDAKEASSPIPRRGVSVALLLATYQRWHAAGRLVAGTTTDDVVRDLVKPATADQKCSYVELLARSQDPQDRAGVATATVFLSHAWKHSFKNVVEAIAAHWPDKGDLRSRTFLWFDIFTVNQHETAKVDQNFWFNAFRENVKDIGHTVLILSPWRNPLPLTRSWCLWEIFCTRDTGATFEICLSQAEAKDFESALLNDFRSIVASLCQIDVNNAQAFKKEDQEKILDLVEGQGGGAHETNKAVLAQMRAWLAQAGRDALRAREGKTDQGTLALMHQVGGLLCEQSYLQRAEELLRSCLVAWEKTIGAEHPDTLTVVNNLAMLLQDQGKLAEAERLYHRALQAKEKTLGAENPSTLTVVHNLATLLKEQGKLAEAERLCRRALQAHEKTLGAEHPSTLTSVNNLAGLLQGQGKLAEAEHLFRRALQAQEKTLGAEHPSTFVSVNNLAGLLQNQGKLGEAEPLFRRALQAQEKTLGTEHPDTLTSGKVTEAEPLFRRALQAEKKTLGAEHPSTLTSVSNLASLLKEQGKLVEAERLFRRALQAQEKTLGAEHPSTLTSVNNLAMLLQDQGKLAEAESLFRRALQARDKTLGPQHPDTLGSAMNLGVLLYQQGRLAEARPLLQRAASGFETVLGTEHPNTQSAKAWLAAASK